MADEPKTRSIQERLAVFHISRDILVKVGMAFLLVLSLSAMFPRGESIELNYKLGAVWAQKDLIAPFSFPIFRDERAYDEDVARAREQVYPVFTRDGRVETAQSERLRAFFAQVRRGIQLRLVQPTGDSVLIARHAGEMSVPLRGEEWGFLVGLHQAKHLGNFERVIGDVVGKYLRAGILNRAKTTIPRSEIAIRKGTQEEIVPLERFFDEGEAQRVLDAELSVNLTDPRAHDLAYKIAIHHVTPTIIFNSEATDIALVAAADAVPRTTGFVQENERVVSKHERITADIKLKLESLRRAKAERGTDRGPFVQYLGIALHVMVVIGLYGIYLSLFRKKIFWRNRRLALIALLILLEGCFAYLTRELNVDVPIEYLIFVPVASMLLTIIFDSRVAFYGTVIIAFLVAGIRGNDYSIALASLVAGVLSVYSVRDVKNRTQIFRSLGFIASGYTLVILALGGERFAPIGVMLEQIGFGLANAVVSPVLTYGLLIFFERVFKVTTDLTLIELSHFHHPLLRQLAERAPGTYHHSMTIASLAEAAASAINANEVLARVGAYFHDIGKTVKPTYFVENQKGGRNKHDKLSPRMSSLIIAAHVKDGVALAREYNLPEEVVDFIPMHHGTTRIEYFYNKALKLAESSDDETRIDEIKEQDYRYPGPKPQTREAGILMLADAVEATSHTLEDPSPQRLELLIDDIIKKRFEEGELDECPLTLTDLTKIKSAFLGVLIGIYHTRVKYPQAEKKPQGRGTKAESGDLKVGV